MPEKPNSRSPRVRSAGPRPEPAASVSMVHRNRLPDGACRSSQRLSGVPGYRIEVTLSGREPNGALRGPEIAHVLAPGASDDPAGRLGLVDVPEEVMAGLELLQVLEDGE